MPSPSKRSKALVAAFLATVLVLVGLPDPVGAFKLHVHENLVRTSLTPAGLTPTVQNEVVGNFALGTGNLGSDRNQADAFRHFDNAPNPATVCTRSRDAWTRFYTEIRSAVTPSSAPEYTAVQGATRARQSFGALTHSLQDFYAHSNWIELFVENGQSLPLAEALFPACDPGQLPGDLQTGFYEFALTNWGGCPSTGAPAGYRYCHEHLNKDDGNSVQGRRTVPGQTVTYHQVAAQLAAAHTSRLYQIVVAQLQIDWSAAFPQVRSNCLVAQVFQESKQPCRYGRLTLANVHNSITLGSGSVDVLGANGQKLAGYSVSGWPVAPIQTSLCLQGASVRWSFTVQDKYSPPTPRRAEGTAQLAVNGCDGRANIDPYASLNYLVRFTSTDTVLPLYTNVIIAINNGARTVNGGAVFAGATVWFNLGVCPTVGNFDFIIQFQEPGTGIPRTATPDPPPFAVSAECQDAITFGNLGKELYP